MVKPYSLTHKKVKHDSENKKARQYVNMYICSMYFSQISERSMRVSCLLSIKKREIKNIGKEHVK